MERFINKISIAFTLVFIVLSLIILYNSFFSQEVDLQIKTVKTDNNHAYKINLHTTQTVNAKTTVDLYYEDGTIETELWDLNKKKAQLHPNETKRLEYLKISSPESIQETSLKNNNYPINIWSPEMKLIESYSMPEYDFLVDTAGRFWLVASCRSEKDHKLNISVTVYSPDGKILFQEPELSSPKSNSRYPTIQAIAEDKILILWSTYLEELDRKVIYYTTFSETDEKIIQNPINEISDEIISLERPIFLNNNSQSETFLLQLNNDNQLGYAMYNVGPNSIDKINQHFFNKYNLINDIYFLQDQQGNFIVIWTEVSEDENKLLMCKFSQKGDLLIEPKKLYGLVSEMRILSLNTFIKDDNLYLYWNERKSFGRTTYQIAQMITNLDGEILLDKTIIIGPSVVPIYEITAQLDKTGNIQKIWVDGRVHDPKPNCELVYQMNTHVSNNIIEYRLTRDRYNQRAPKLELFDDYRYLTWRVYQDHKYHIYLKTTQPVLLEGITNLTKWDILRNKINMFIASFVTSFGFQLFLFIPLNFFPFAVLLIFILLFSHYKIKNTRSIWAGIISSTFFFKLLTFHVMQNKFASIRNVNIQTSYTITVMTFLIIGSFYLIKNSLQKKDVSGIERKFKYILSWLVLDSVIFILISNMHTF